MTLKQIRAVAGNAKRVTIVEIWPSLQPTIVNGLFVGFGKCDSALSLKYKRESGWEEAPFVHGPDCHPKQSGPRVLEVHYAGGAVLARIFVFGD